MNNCVLKLMHMFLNGKNNRDRISLVVCAVCIAEIFERSLLIHSDLLCYRFLQDSTKKKFLKLSVMGRAKHCSDTERKTIKKLRKIEKTIREIAAIMECSKNMVFNALKPCGKKAKRGRKRKTSMQFDHLVVRESKKDPFLPSNEIKERLNAPVTSQTIRNRLREAGFNGRSARKVPYLSKNNVNQRLQFAQRHLLRENWKNVLWSDETKVNIFGSDGRMFVRRPPNAEFNPLYT